MSQDNSLHLDHVMFVDFEACSLAQGSWPIEVGLSWCEEGKARTWSSLIRPAEGWDQSLWSRQSQKIHGISLNELGTAPSAAEVADEVSRRCAGKWIFSNAPDHDGIWMDRLIAQKASLVSPWIAGFDQAAEALCGPVGVNWAYERLHRPAPHRAGPDAARLMKAIVFGMRRAR